MSEKFRVQILNDDGSVQVEMCFKSYRAIAKTLNLEYHVVRSLEQLTENKVTRKYLHPTLKELSKKFKVFQNIKQYDFELIKKILN